MCPVVRCENNQGIFLNSEITKFIQNLPYMVVQHRNHARKRRMALRLRAVSTHSIIGSIICSFVVFLRKELPSKTGHISLRNEQFRVGDDVWNETEKRLVLVLFDEVECLFLYELRSVYAFMRTLIGF